MVNVPLAVLAPFVSTAFTATLPLLVESGTNMSHEYAPLAEVTVKSDCPVTDTRIVLLFGKPTTANFARLPAVSTEGETIRPGVFVAGCSLAAASPADQVKFPPSKFCW